MSTYYQILGLESRQYHALTAADVKTAYKRALLQNHPDKLSSAVTLGRNGSAVTVDEISQAYKTLADPSLRAEYDRALFQGLKEADNLLGHKTLHTGLEIVDLDSMTFDDTTQIWSRKCRCGDARGFVLTEAELDEHAEEGELIIGCEGCSLWLKVLFSIAD